MRVTTALAIGILVLCLALYWVPIPPIALGDTVLILGGYPWQAPTPQARSFFVALGIALTAAIALLAVLAYIFGRGLEESREESADDFE